MESTRLEFIHVPLSDAVGFLRDMHDVGIQVLDQHEAPITLKLRGVPFCMAFSEIADTIDGDWCCDRQLIVMGSRDRIQQVRQLEWPRLRRSARIALMDSPCPMRCVKRPCWNASTKRWGMS